MNCTILFNVIYIIFFTEIDSQNGNEKDFSLPIDQSDRNAWRKAFYGDQKNIVSLQACMKMDPLEVCLSRSRIEESNNVFTYKVS